MSEAELTVPSLDGGDDVADYDDTAKKIPHYALPNVAAILPDFSNVEQETIMQAFRAGNCACPPPRAPASPRAVAALSLALALALTLALALALPLDLPLALPPALPPSGERQ